MRFVLFSILMTFWFGLCWWIYVCHIKALCTEGDPVLTETEIVEEQQPPLGPIVYKLNESEPVLRDDFVFFRDSLVALLTKGQALQITGLYASTEGVGESLGQMRALGALDVIAPQLDSARYRLLVKKVDQLAVLNDSLVEAIEFRIVVSNASVEEFDDKAIIYFPFNSTKKIDNPDIENYLQKLVRSMNDSGTKVHITGHSDAFGPADENYKLGIWRAEAIQEWLVAQGVGEQYITIESKGEEEPIANNNTKEGAKLNRRVEIQILNQ